MATSQNRPPRRQYIVKAPLDRKDREGKVVDSFFHTIGRGFENEPKDNKPATISIDINSLPVGVSSPLRLVLFEDVPSDRDGDR
jgi:hypothetical protein